MDNYSVRQILKQDIFTIIPLLKLLNEHTPNKLLKERLLEMINQNYECIGLFDGKSLIGICGLWFSTRHYVGKTAEVEHVIINNEYRNKGLGQFYFGWIYN